MGNSDSKLNFRKAVIQLTTKTQPIDAKDDIFWDQFWSESVQSVQDVFTLIPAAEIRALREESPSNLATLCYKAVEKLVKAADTLCNTLTQQQIVMNCIHLLTRILPYIFEEPDWRGFFWSSLPSQNNDETDSEIESLPLAQSLITALCDLLFCPDFTVSLTKRSGPLYMTSDHCIHGHLSGSLVPSIKPNGNLKKPMRSAHQHILLEDNADDLQSIDSCEYIWEAGVGFAHSPAHVPQHDYNRTEILKLLLTCFSQTMYLPSGEAHEQPNKWIRYFTSADNRHALPLFTSLLNIVAEYDPVGYGLPFNHLLFTDSREPLVEVALQVLIVTLDHDFRDTADENNEKSVPENLFINYLSRIHREEDFSFVLKGFTRLLNNPLIQTYLPNSTKKIQFHQELLIFFWKMCDYNKKFMFYVLKSSEVLEVLVPILYHLNDARADQSRVGLVHIGVFILLLLSGERNFGVRLNKPYTASISMDIPVFTGTHADLLIIVFHKIITTGHQRLQPLFDCLLTIIVNGNSNLVYTIIRKRNVFHSLANLPTDHSSIQKSLNKRTRLTSSTSVNSIGSGNATSSVNNKMDNTNNNNNLDDVEDRVPPKHAEKGTLNASLAATPCIDKMTEQEQAHLSGHGNSNEASSGDQPSSKEDGNTVISQSLEPEGQETTKRSPCPSPPASPSSSVVSSGSEARHSQATVLPNIRGSSVSNHSIGQGPWLPTTEWVLSWKQKLPLQTIMRLLQVLVPQVEKICIDKGLTDESEILKFLQHGTLVGLLPIPHPILIRKYQANSGTTMWFRTYMWGVIYLRNVDPPIWYDTDVKLFEIQRI